MKLKPQQVSFSQRNYPTLKTAKFERIKCSCMAMKHKLINNCLNCGKVICESEGEGPCMFCGNIVSRPDNQFVDRNDAQLFPELDPDELKKVSMERSKAIQHKNVLIDRDTSNSLVQNIYDQQTDYYELSENQWVSEADRKLAIEKIICENKMIRDETETAAVHFDGDAWVRDRKEHDNAKFKQEAQEYIKEAENRDLKKKIEKGKDHNMLDQRILVNEKASEVMKQVNQEFEKFNNPQQKKKRLKTEPKSEYKGIQTIGQPQL